MAAQQRGSKWTPEEGLRLLELVEARKSWVFISAKLKRPTKSIRDHLRHLRRQAKKADLDSGPVESGLKAEGNEPFNVCTAAMDRRRAKETGRPHGGRKDRRR
jgi:hypothetical protein